MSTQPFLSAAASTREVLTAVTADDMSKPTPCASWDVAALINHTVGAQHFFLAGLTGQPPVGADADYASGDFLAAFDEGTAAVNEKLAEPGALGKMFKLPFGEMPGGALMGLATNDTFQHGWDLAKAIGQPTDLNPELAAAILAQAQQSIQDGFRGPEGAPFGVEQPCSDDACAADKLAAFLGRSVES